MEEKKNKLFREKSLEKISSPDQLDKYIKTASPTVIILLISVAILLIGMLVWSFVGTIEVKSTVGFYVNETHSVITYISENDYEANMKSQTADDISKNMFFSFNEEEVYVATVDSTVRIFDFAKDYKDQEKLLLSYAGIKENERYFEVTAVNCKSNEGVYKGKIIFSSSSPIRYVFM